MARSRRLFIGIVAALLIVALFVTVGVGLMTGWLRPSLTQEEVQDLVVTTIQREAPASFFVTGTLDVAATVKVENTRYLFPDVFDLNLGTTRSTVRVPGRVSYGFDIRQLRAEHIRIGEDGVVEVTLPELELYAAEPDLDAMEVETEVGWARLHRSSGQRVEQRAIRNVQRALRQQGASYLETSRQPRIYTAEAMQKLLTPALQAAGLETPRFRIQIGPELVMSPPG